MRALTWRGETTIGEDYTVEEIPADMVEQAQAAHHALIELVADYDDDLMEAYLTDEDSSTPELLQEAIRRAVLSIRDHRRALWQRVQEQGCAAAAGRRHRVPAVPARRARHQRLQAGRRVGQDRAAPGRDADPFSALAYKIAADPHLGRLTYIRLYSGKLEAGSTVLNATKGRKERIGKIYQMHANKRAGDRLGRRRPDRRRDGSQGHHHRRDAVRHGQPGQLESMDFPAPVIEQAIEPKTKSDQEKLGIAIQRLAEEDPTFRVHTDDETGQTIIAGMGELHLEILIDRMKREFRVEANIGKPQVAYRETLRRAVEKVEYTHKKQSGGSGQYAQGDHQRWSRRSRARATSSSTQSPVVASPGSTSRRSTRAFRTPCSSVCWPVTRSRTSR